MKKLPAFCLFLISASTCFAGAAPVHMGFTVDGVKREAAVYYPSDAIGGPRPLILAFHGHGGSMRTAASSFGFHTRWPEAIVVYPQGLPTPIRLTDPEGKKPGWQCAPGENGDRDLAFFDAVLAAMKKTGRVDERRIYAAGHSNGGIFVYLLWAVRGDVFAAVATSSSRAATGEIQRRLTPKPLFHIAGEKDPIVKYDLQMETISYVLSMNGCGTAVPRWNGNRLCTLHPSTNGTPVVTWLHRGGHVFQSEAVPLIVAFLKEHAKP